MTAEITFTTAASFSLEALAALFTRSFEAYFYPGATTAQVLSRRVRVEQIELLHSPIVLVDGQPAGMALLARRGDLAWCGGFGIVLAQRQRGLAQGLATELIGQARAAGARQLSLEVLTRNEAALRVYQRAGLRITRQLKILAWRPGDGDPPAPPYPLVEADPAQLVLGHFAALHPARAAWQRDAAALLTLSDLQGLALSDVGIRAYALISGDVEGMRIQDLGARDVGAADLLLGALQSRTRSLLSINEPADSPLSAAFARRGFSASDEQHEMMIDL